MVEIRPRYSAQLPTATKLQDLDKTSDGEKIALIVHAARDEAENCPKFLEFKDQFVEAYCFYKGDQWLDENLQRNEARWGRYRTIRDICFQTVETVRPLLTDMRPTIYYQADYPDLTVEELRLRKELRAMGVPIDETLPPEMMPRNLSTNGELASKLTDIVQAEHERREEELLLSVALADTVIGGLAWRKVYWDKQNKRLGIKQISPLDVFIDPYCEDHCLRDAKYVVIRKLMDADDAQRIYRISNERMRRLVSEAQPKVELYDDFGTFRRGTSLKSDAYIRTTVEVLECWFKGQTPFELEYEGESKAIKHPRGRVFVVIGDEAVAVMDNPFEHGEIPLIGFRNYVIPDLLPYAFGEIKPIRENQISLNILLSQIMMNAILMSNNQWIAEEGAIAGEDPTNVPGLVIRTLPGKSQAVRKEPGMDVPSSLINVLGLIEGNARDITRITDAARGVNPGSHASGVQVENVQNAALSPIRFKAKHLESAYRRQGYFEARVLQQFFKDRGNVFEPVERGEMDLGEYLEWEERMSGLLFDVKIESKAELPSNILDRMVFAQNQVATGIFDALEAVEFVKIPISDRLREKLQLAEEIQRQVSMAQLQQFQAQSQMMAQQSSGAPMGAPMGAGMAPPQSAPPI